MKQRLFSSWGPGSFFASSFHRLPFPSNAAALTYDSYHERQNLPHTVGSSRFGGHCTSSGGCSGVVGGKSIFHDDVVAASPAASSLALPLSLSSRPYPRCVSVLALTRHVNSIRAIPKRASSSRCRSIDTS